MCRWNVHKIGFEHLQWRMWVDTTSTASDPRKQSLCALRLTRLFFTFTVALRLAMILLQIHA